MHSPKALLVVLLAVLLATMIGPAYADETDCRGIITLLDGGKVEVRDLSVRLMEASSPDTELLVFFDGGQSVINLNKLKRITRLHPPGEAQRGQKVRFAFETADGQKGEFKIWAEYIFSGRMALGRLSERAAKIKCIELSCPASDLTPSD